MTLDLCIRVRIIDQSLHVVDDGSQNVGNVLCGLVSCIQKF